MGTVSLLHHVNGGEPMLVQCASCKTVLTDERERCAASTPSGTRFFCKADPEHPQDSCYLQWKRRLS
jgi:hypothetical protein